MPPSKKAKTAAGATPGGDLTKSDSSPHARPRVPILPLDIAWVKSVRVNPSAVNRAAAELPGRRTVKKEWQLAWLLRAVTNIDLTTLAGDDTPGNVERLCAKAKKPVRPDILEAIGCSELNLTTGAVCV